MASVLYGDVPIDQTLTGDELAINTRPTDYHIETALGRRTGSVTWNKFGYNLDVDTGTEELIASWGGAFDPATDIMTTAQTFSIAFNDTTDGDGTTGATALFFTYIDENNEHQTALHTLSGTSPDTTSFTGLGINRVVVLSNGGAGYNTNAITMTASSDATTQAQIPAQASVTQQCIFHTPINNTLLTEWLYITPSGGGGNSGASINIKAYSWSRVTLTRYDVGQFFLDTGNQSDINIAPPLPFVVGGREVLYFTCTTDTNNTEVGCRFSGELIDISTT